MSGSVIVSEDLPKSVEQFAPGETIKIELENRASDRAFEAAYWSRIELVE